MRHELGHRPVPGGAVAGGMALELLHVRLVRGRQEGARAIREQGPRREVGVQVLDAPGAQLVLQLGVDARADEERMPRREDLVDEPRLGDLRRADRAAQVVVPLEHEHPLPAAGEQRRAGERVDAAADDDDVVRPAHVIDLPSV